MAKQYFENNVSATLVRNASSTDTVLYFDDVSMFPNVTSGDFFLLTIFSAAALGVESNWEVVKVTAVNYSDKSVTCQRGYEIGASVHVAGELAQMRTTARTLNVLRDGIGAISGENGADLVGIGGGRTQADKNAELISVRDYITTVIDGTTSNQAGIVAAVAAAYAAGAQLYWPAGTYVSDANIPNFHSVQHVGSGVLKRGSDTWVISGKTGNHVIYVSTTGSDSNDGLTNSFPKQTISAAFTSLQNWQDAAMNNSTFIIDIAAGTYAGIARLINFKTRNELIVRGAAMSAGQPTTIIDGTGAILGGFGLWFEGDMYVTCQRIKAINFNDSSDDATGFVAYRHTRLRMEDCWSDNCDRGVNASTASRLIFVRGGAKNCFIGIETYAGTSFTVGVVGAAEADMPYFYNCTAGFEAQDAATGHVDFCKFDNCQTGITLSFAAHSAVWGCIFTPTIGRPLDVRTCSSIGENPSYPNDFGGKVNYYYWASGRTSDQRAFRYDPATNRFTFADTANDGAFYAPVHVRPSAASYTVQTAGQTFGVESSASTSIQLSAGSDAFNSSIWFGDSTNYRRGEIKHNAAIMYIAFSNINAYQWSSTIYRPSVDNAVALGSVTGRWTQLYAANGTINTSDGREKTSPLPIDDAVLDAWADVQLIAFQWLEMVAQKGDAARWHFGVIAQQVRDAFTAHGLDGTRYGLLCYDEWEDQYEPVMAVRENPETGEQEEYDTGEVQLVRAAGNRWGIRADQCLFLEAAYQRRRSDRIEQRLIELENK